MTPRKDYAIWVFDSQCVLCDGGVHYTLKNEKTDSIRFVSIQSPEGRALAMQHGIDPDDPGTFLFIENGRALQKSDGVIALSRHLKGPARVVPLLKIIPKPLRDFGYGIIARNRYRLFGKKETCIAPSADTRRRFGL
ncbi:thiol-disulfide oxidoreductase DCC family protein [Litoreibacter roseus]|uniref:Thiol-disulfide oxidoreductase n=1 Tax=Litoreibacter roseus TaxID=2601869 RepID=A0A6N6JDE5_9RHOB|nr:thiol-disulfide oxidoreductase DCC family protein [Litoreibacter roseus]GFE63399.1 thiol-disulfide oxidoreductase [Litoreibacter roseus]